jgi:tetratricopeptide (TPR) repeat protein
MIPMRLPASPKLMTMQKHHPSRPAHAWRQRSAGLCLVAALLGATALGAHAAPLDDMRRQVEASQFAQAWQTAQANPQLIGDVHFDFLYGVAAINVGRVPEGLLALERHLAAVPANDRARLELARGYFLLGEFTRARAEFEFVLRYNPPAGVRANINGFLQAMQLRESGSTRAAARVYAEAGLGHDNNVNGGTFRDEMQIVFGSASIDDNAKQVPDSFAHLAVGGQQLLRVTQRLSVFAGADLEHRANFKEHAFDISNGGLNVGFTQLSGSALWRATLGVNEMRVGGRRYRDTLAVGTEANVTLSAEQSFMAFAQFSELRHARDNANRDARATTLGGMFTQTLADAAGAPSFGVRLSYTQEGNALGSTDLDRKMPLLRVFAAASPAERTRVTLGVTAYRQDFGGTDAAFGTVRRDDTLAADLLVNVALDNQWSLRGEASYTANRSNQDLYDSNRASAAVKLRYQF